MSFCFWRRIKIAHGVTLNLSKSSGSISFGPRGAKFKAGGKGKRVAVGLTEPEDTGSYREKLPVRRKSR
ncbi:MAG: DUF4236 domain-containing protein [Candidatus Brocadia sp.]